MQKKCTSLAVFIHLPHFSDGIFGNFYFRRDVKFDIELIKKCGLACDLILQCEIINFSITKFLFFVVSLKCHRSIFQRTAIRPTARCVLLQFINLTISSSNKLELFRCCFIFIFGFVRVHRLFRMIYYEICFWCVLENFRVFFSFLR